MADKEEERKVLSGSGEDWKVMEEPLGRSTPVGKRGNVASNFNVDARTAGNYSAPQASFEALDHTVLTCRTSRDEHASGHCLIHRMRTLVRRDLFVGQSLVAHQGTAKPA
jgi:hypothetical protein